LIASDIEIHKIIRSKRRTIALQIGRDALLIVRAPLKTPEKAIFEFINLKKSWVKKNQERARQKLLSTPKREFKDGESFPYLGESYKLRIAYDYPNKLTFDSGFFLSTAKARKAGELFIRWYKKAAIALIAERTRYYATRLGINYESIKITSGRGNWGSCRGQGRLIFNWRIIMAQLQIIDYVIVHELVHVIERNHSRRYWNKISSIYPNYQSCKKWLKQNGHLLEI